MSGIKTDAIEYTEWSGKEAYAVYLIGKHYPELCFVKFDEDLFERPMFISSEEKVEVAKMIDPWTKEEMRAYAEEQLEKHTFIHDNKNVFMREPKIERVKTHPGEILKEEFFADMSRTWGQFAEDTGIPRNILLRLVNGNESITVEIAFRLARYLDTTPEFWMNLQTEYDKSVLFVNGFWKTLMDITPYKDVQIVYK